MKVGFIGLGRMGQGMAGRIHGAGYALSVFDAIAAQTAALAAAGARVAARSPTSARSATSSSRCSSRTRRF